MITSAFDEKGHFPVAAFAASERIRLEAQALAREDTSPLGTALWEAPATAGCGSNLGGPIDKSRHAAPEISSANAWNKDVASLLPGMSTE